MFLLEDLFDVKDIDQDGKKFDNGPPRPPTPLHKPQRVRGNRGPWSRTGGHRASPAGRMDCLIRNPSIRACLGCKGKVTRGS